MLGDLALVGSLFFLKALHKFVDFSFLLIEVLILLGFITLPTGTSSSALASSLLLLEVLFDLLHIPLVSVNDLPDITDILFNLFDLSIVLLDPIQ